jgi:hypothetical protein
MPANAGIHDFRLVAEESASFLKKEKQKTFAPIDHAAEKPVTQRQTKVFWFFFSKKNVLLKR